MSLPEAQADIYVPSVVPASQGALDLNSGPFLLTSFAKLPCLPWCGTPDLCQEAIRAFMGATGVLGTCLPSQALSASSYFLLIQIYRLRRRLFYSSGLCPLSTGIPAHAWLPQWKVYFHCTRTNSMTCIPQLWFHSCQRQT